MTGTRVHLEKSFLRLRGEVGVGETDCKVPV